MRMMKKFTAVLLSLLLVALAAGCSGSGETAEQAASAMLDALKSGDTETASEYIDYDAIVQDAGAGMIGGSDGQDASGSGDAENNGSPAAEDTSDDEDASAQNGGEGGSDAGDGSADKSGDESADKSGDGSAGENGDKSDDENGGEGDDTASGTEDEDMEIEMLRLVFQNLSYKIISSDEKGDEATVEAEITNTDMGSVMQELIQRLIVLAFSGIDESEIDAKMMEIMNQEVNKDEIETVTNTVTMNLKKTDGKWKISTDDALADALTGGMMTFAERMGSAFSE